MKTRRMFSLAIVAGLMTFAASFAQAASITGKVRVNNHPALAVVGAVPYDTVTHTTHPELAKTTTTDAFGRFTLPQPSGPFLLVAWDGRNGTVLESPASGSTLVMTDQTNIVMPACTTRCYCSHLFGNLYWVWAVSDCGYGFSVHYINWGCRC